MLGLCVLQHDDLLPPGHCQIPQIHQQPAEDAAANSQFLINDVPFFLTFYVSFLMSHAEINDLFRLDLNCTMNAAQQT